MRNTTSSPMKALPERFFQFGLLCVVTSSVVVSAAGLALADSRTQIAPPGPCAEPRETTAYVAPSAPTPVPGGPTVGTDSGPGAGPGTGTANEFATAPGLTARKDTFSVVGPLPDLFDPSTDVASGPMDGLLTNLDPPMAVRRVESPGSCESGAGCGLGPGISVRNPPIIAGTRPPR